MRRLLFILSVIEIISSQNSFPPTPIEFRGLWCIVQGNNTQLGQAFFYNNGTFTLNFLNNIQYTWINHFVGIHRTVDQGTYRVLTDTTKGPPIYVNKTSCFWRRQISNGDIIWGRQSNGTCTPSFEIDDSSQSTRYTRNSLNCTYVDDENPTKNPSDTRYEDRLLQFDQSLKDSSQQSIVFYGSSSIVLWSTLEKDFSNVKYNVINRGFGGSTLQQCLEQFKRVILPLDPRLLIIYAGENDISENQTSVSIQNNFRQFISIVRRFFPSLPIVFISIKPSPSRSNQFLQQNETNHLIQKDIESMDNIHYIDIFNKMLANDQKPRADLFISDNLHMNEKGYAIWTQEVQNYLHANGFISKGFIDSPITYLIFALNLFVFFAK